MHAWTTTSARQTQVECRHLRQPFGRQLLDVQRPRHSLLHPMHDLPSCLGHLLLNLSVDVGDLFHQAEKLPYRTVL